MLLPILTTLFLQFQGLNAQAVDANGITLEEKKEAGGCQFPVARRDFCHRPQLHNQPQQTVAACYGSFYPSSQELTTVRLSAHPVRPYAQRRERTFQRFGVPPLGGVAALSFHSKGLSSGKLSPAA